MCQLPLYVAAPRRKLLGCPSVYLIRSDAHIHSLPPRSPAEQYCNGFHLEAYEAWQSQNSEHAGPDETVLQRFHVWPQQAIWRARNDPSPSTQTFLWGQAQHIDSTHTRRAIILTELSQCVMMIARFMRLGGVGSNEQGWLPEIWAPSICRSCGLCTKRVRFDQVPLPNKQNSKKLWGPRSLRTTHRFSLSVLTRPSYLQKKHQLQLKKYTAQGQNGCKTGWAGSEVQGRYTCWVLGALLKASFRRIRAKKYFSIAISDFSAQYSCTHFNFLSH